MRHIAVPAFLPREERSAALQIALRLAACIGAERTGSRDGGATVFRAACDCGVGPPDALMRALPVAAPPVTLCRIIR